MARRKKQPGYSPRENAREQVRSIMRGINTTEKQFLDGSKIHADKIDKEMERIAGLQSEELRTYLEQWLKNSQAAFLGALMDFKQKLGVIRTDADAKAVKLMEIIDGHRWDETKDVVGIALVELSGSEIQCDGLAHETLLLTIDAATAYEQRRECVRTGLRNNWTVPDVVEKLKELDDKAVVVVQAKQAESVEPTEKETVDVE